MVLFIRFGCLLPVLEYAWTKGAEGAGACSSLVASAAWPSAWSVLGPGVSVLLGVPLVVC